MTTERSIKFPNRPDGDLTVHHSPLVIIGANGSGKTRLGAWIEESNQGHVQGGDNRCHRIAGQRALSWPESSVAIDSKSAIHALHYGMLNANNFNKRGNRWGGHPATYALNDFQHLLTAINSKAVEEIWSEKKKADDGGQQSMTNPFTVIDRVKSVWNAVHPQRQIDYDGGAFKLGAANEAYQPKDMSDGERATFYLIAQSMLAPSNGILVVDEPELHLHRAVMGQLWDAIEAERPDLLFVYLTHDFEFATSRNAGLTISIKSFEPPETWEWDPVEGGIVNLPEPERLRLLGSRRPVLFVEGIRGGLDERLFATLYPKHLVVPIGGCDAVIHMVASLRASDTLNHLHPVGIVDRDERDDSTVKDLREQGVYCHPARAIEQLLCHPVVLQAVSGHVGGDWSAARSKVVQRIRESLGSEQQDWDKLATAMAWATVERELKSIQDAPPAAATAKAHIATHADPKRWNRRFDDLHAEHLVTVQDLVHRQPWSDQDILSGLRIAKDRGLTKQIARALGVTDSLWVNLWMKVIRENPDCRDAIVSEIKL